ISVSAARCGCGPKSTCTRSSSSGVVVDNQSAAGTNPAAVIVCVELTNLVLHPGSKLSNGFAPDIRFAMVIPIVRGVRNRLGDFLRRFKATTFQRQRA